MFGFFTKTDLSLSERAALMLSITHICLMAIVKHDTWLQEELRADAINLWLTRNNRKASIPFRARMSLVANEMAKHIVMTEGREGAVEFFELLNIAQATKPGTDPAVDQFLHRMLGECERVIVSKGLAG